MEGDENGKGEGYTNKHLSISGVTTPYHTIKQKRTRRAVDAFDINEI